MPRMPRLASFVLVASIVSGVSVADAQPADAAPKNPVAVMKTSMGDIHIEFFPAEAPLTVKNFLALAYGEKEFTDPKTKEKVKRPFFNGLGFHRVIDNFMVQGGCPLGNGMGSPGFSFKDEINATALGLDKMKAVENGKPNMWLLIRSQQDFQRMLVGPIFRKLGITSQEQLDKRKDEVTKALDALTLKTAYENLGYVFDPKLPSRPPKRGTLAMANSGPNTNGSQFFICLVDNDYLTGKHTVFGRVIKGMEVVDKIGKVKVDAQSKPTTPVTIESIERGTPVTREAPKPAAAPGTAPKAPEKAPAKPPEKAPGDLPAKTDPGKG